MVRQQPLTGLDHAARGQYETRLVRWIGSAQIQASKQAGHDRQQRGKQRALAGDVEAEMAGDTRTL